MIHRHVYLDSDSFFAKRIKDFHEDFVECFLLIGIDQDNTPIDKIKMTKNPKMSMLYYKRIVGGILATKPLLYIQSFLDQKLHTSCNIYYLNNNNDIEDFFLYQKVKNWNGSQKSCHQIWRLHFSSLNEMHHFWLNEELQ